MREILFRGKAIDSGEWIEGYFCPCSFGRFPCKDAIVSKDKLDNGSWEPRKVDENTVGQYIGFTDVNGRKVFEGDIVKLHHEYYCADKQYSRDLKLSSACEYLAVVVYKDSGYYLEDMTHVRPSIFADDLRGFKDGSLVLGNAVYSRSSDRYGFFSRTEDTALCVVGTIHDGVEYTV